jgi:MoxR-like ATPase
MAKKKADDSVASMATDNNSNGQGNVLRAPAEELYAHELDALAQADKHERPPGWKLSPRAVLTYIAGGTVGGMTITPKYLGYQRLVEIAISTLVTDRSLLLIGEPGTAKSWLSEHLAAAINRDSTKVVQGTAGTTEEQIRYTWNYALLISQGPSNTSLIRSPIMRAMEAGAIARFEEITRCASEVQDAMISLLSEKRISIPELQLEIPAQKGFSVIATANTRDRGVNDMSAALKRRFNIVVLPAPATLETEVDIVRRRVHELAKNQLKSPSGVLSTAEAISVLAGSMALAGNFGDGKVSPEDLASSIQGAVIKDEEKDNIVWQEYLSNVLKKRGADWRPLFTACSDKMS